MGSITIKIPFASKKNKQSKAFIRLNKNGMPCKQDIDSTLYVLYKAGELTYRKMQALKHMLPTKEWMSVVNFIDKRYERIWLDTAGVIIVGALHKKPDYINTSGICNINGKIRRIQRINGHLVLHTPIISDKGSSKPYGVKDKQRKIIVTKIHKS